MAAKRSAGILLYRLNGGEAEVLLVHPGGPFWANKDEGAWSIPKGEYEDGEDPEACARREFAEETGAELAPGELADLGSVKQKSGKQVTAWAVEGDLDAAAAVSNTVELEWPRGSGRQVTFPEMDRFAWVDLATARALLVTAQAAFLDRLAERVTSSSE